MLVQIFCFRFLLPDINISQGSVATHFRRGGSLIITDFLMILTVKQKVNIGQYLTHL